ncbi:gametocyte-specific factor 1-like [Malaclemys terrapin pileata]|uniref:gametocyte-specific factor 1-like n=1 Tax=Malaclemys terrapin pileata TaxID=2991368 RepID=UPI0023A886C4|nr:gametocyte-specific factor 1-like [Malaclemys terrapin pileata]
MHPRLRQSGVTLSQRCQTEGFISHLKHSIEQNLNHPDVAKQLATCPFNARHQVPRAEIGHHISSCDDKSCIEQDIVSQSNNCHREKMSTVSMWQPSPCDEDWDKDLQEQTNSTFVWGTFNSGINNSPGSSVVMEPKNKLMPGMRAPKSLPYSLSWKSSKCKGRWSPPAVSWDLHVSSKWNRTTFLCILIPRVSILLHKLKCIYSHHQQVEMESSVTQSSLEAAAFLWWVECLLCPGFISL